MTDLNGSVAVVTGGRVGLGRALALEAARRGATVVIASQSDASSTVREIGAAGGTAEWVRTDVAEYAEVAALARHVERTHGGVNLVINNAAAEGGLGGLDMIDPASAHRVFDVNIAGVFNGIHAFAPALRATAASGGEAAILNVGSEHSLGVPPHVMAVSAYTVSKYATLAFTDTARRDFAGSGVQVSLFAPGWILTERIIEMTEASIEAAAAILPLAQDPADVARAGIDGLLRGEYIIVTHRTTWGFAIDHAQRIIDSLESARARIESLSD